MDATEIRDLCHQWLEEHRLECHKTPCIEPLNFLGFLCHSIGIGVKDAGRLTEAIRVYEEICPNCPHLRN
jgi:hypothetical protein